jgi:hypothetical protein
LHPDRGARIGRFCDPSGVGSFLDRVPGVSSLCSSTPGYLLASLRDAQRHYEQATDQNLIYTQFGRHWRLVTADKPVSLPTE